MRIQCGAKVVSGFCVRWCATPGHPPDLDPYIPWALTGPAALLLTPEHLWFSLAAPGGSLIITLSILITPDPRLFCPDLAALYSVPEFRSFWHLTSGSPDPEVSPLGISFCCLLPPDTLCRHTIILISPTLPAICPDRNWSFFILSIHVSVISRCHQIPPATSGTSSDLPDTNSIMRTPFPPLSDVTLRGLQ